MDSYFLSAGQLYLISISEWNLDVSPMIFMIGYIVSSKLEKCSFHFQVHERNRPKLNFTQLIDSGSEIVQVSLLSCLLKHLSFNMLLLVAKFIAKIGNFA